MVEIDIRKCSVGAFKKSNGIMFTGRFENQIIIGLTRFDTYTAEVDDTGLKELRDTNGCIVYEVSKVDRPNIDVGKEQLVKCFFEVDTNICSKSHWNIFLEKGINSLHKVNCNPESGAWMTRIDRYIGDVNVLYMACQVKGINIISVIYPVREKNQSLEEKNTGLHLLSNVVHSLPP